MSEEIWEKVWAKNLVISDYSLKYLDFINTLKTDLQHDSKILEAGCGTGQTLALFSDDQFTSGLDISVAALRRAQKNCSNAVLGSIFSIPFDDDAFDLVYNSGVIEHFRDPENIAALREMARVVKPSGKIVIIVPNTLCLWYKAGKWAAVLMKNFEFGYEEDYSLSRLEHAMKRAGLIVEKRFGLQAFPPLATNDREILPVSLRKILGRFEYFLPAKQYYAYTVGVIARKPACADGHALT
ncbi:class I SAM-dependent methyltransferase [Methanoregula sp.]|uniref:class I SAM-dependent methyltransferase n=1 Tax=Methanoregula sp. TaxID=2052170 RepID=UPI003BAEDC4E